MTRSITFSLLLTIILLSIPGALRCQPRVLDSTALVRTQVYLDSLWAIYDAVGDSTASAQTRMVRLLDTWDEDRKPGEMPDGGVIQVCRSVYSDVFRSHYYSNVRTEEKRGLVATVRTPYLLIPDSVRFTVVTDSAIWDTLSGRAGDSRARNTILYSHPGLQKFIPALKMPAKIIHIEQAQYEALNCFINGESTAQERSTERSPHKDRFDWLCEFFPICFSHGGDRYPLYARPSIGIIALNHELTEAVVPFSPWC
ncbi:MAG: hypothetical protein WC824_12585, partial [Bacteroidota bacterium]